jgi:nitrogen PTS system EIIA component
MIMKSLLDALKDGRLVELSVSEKTKALETLALLLEAVPGIGSGVDIVKGVIEREGEAATAMGKGVACPHMRTKEEGEFLCAVGWSPAGIDYSAPDGRPVHIIIMYYIPDSQRAAFLKELSSLAKALSKATENQLFDKAADLGDIRNRLLDIIELSIKDAEPDAKARMIRLEEKQGTLAASLKKSLSVIPFSLVVAGEGATTLLSHDPEFIGRFEKSKDIERLAVSDAPVETNDYFIAVTSSVYFAQQRILREGVAIRKK